MIARALFLMIVPGAMVCLGAVPGTRFDQKRFITVQSRSQQFTVQGLPASRSFAGTVSGPDVTYVRLDPTMFAMAAENVKQALLSILDTADNWQSSINVSLYPVRRDGEEIVITSARSPDGWDFRLSVPELANKRHVLKAILEVLLLEIAHRNGVERRIELPPWLVPGLAAHLEATATSPLVVQPESRTSARRKLQEAVSGTRETLRASGGLTLDDLNWPTERVTPTAYEASAHLFVRELLHKDGGAAFSNMLRRLRDHYNWHTAFLQAFGFPSLREVDKWWTLHLVQFAGRESLSIWSTGEINTQLLDILSTPVQVRHSTNELPVATQIPLDRVIQEWEFQRQEAVLRQKLVQLDALRMRSPTNVVTIVAGYHQSLSDYLARREQLGVNRPPNAPIVRTLVRRTLQRLGDLDVRREIAVGGASGTAALKPSN
jgi:hypothetical protein